MIDWLLIKMDVPEVLIIIFLLTLLFRMGRKTEHEVVKSIYFCTLVFSIILFLIVKTPVG